MFRLASRLTKRLVARPLSSGFKPSRVFRSLSLRSSPYLATQRKSHDTTQFWLDRADSEETKQQILGYKSHFAEMENFIKASPTEVPEIDWADWSKKVKTPGVVDKLKKLSDSIKVPEPKDAVNESEFKSELENYATYAKEAEERLKQIDVDIAVVQENKRRLKNVVIDDILDAYPELRQRFFDEFDENWVDYPEHDEGDSPI